MPKPTPKKRQYSHSRTLVLVACGMLVILAVLLSRRSNYHASSTESVCVAVTVIGLNGGDPGSAFCNPPVIAVSSSSEPSGSSGSSEPSGSSHSSAFSTARSVSTDEDDGGRRYSIEESQSSIGRLIAQWKLRYKYHRAAGSSSSRPSLPFTDVPRGSWFEEAVREFMERGLLDVSVALFRPADGATRAEASKLLVLVHSALQSQYPTTPSFDDVPVHAWFYEYIEDAARNGWMLGYGDCYVPATLATGNGDPCFTRPAAIVSRAEAAALIIRSFHLMPLYTAPVFDDVPEYAWYADEIQIATDHCILQGDLATHHVRPDDRVTRAELVTMLHRAEQKIVYGTDCARGTPVLLHPAAPVIDVPVTMSVSLDTDGSPVASASQSICLSGVWTCVSRAFAGDAISMLHSAFNALIMGGHYKQL